MKQITREELATAPAGEGYWLPEFKMMKSFDIVNYEMYEGEHRRIARVFDELPGGFAGEAFDTSIRPDGKIVVEAWQRNDDTKDRYRDTAITIAAREPSAA